MDGVQRAEAAYKDMYAAMIKKDGAALDKLLTDDFVLIHMTGMRQGKAICPQHLPIRSLLVDVADAFEK